MSHRTWLIVIGIASLPGAALGQVTDYTAGKTPAQLFAGDCQACHQSPRGLSKGKDTRSLASFLREHYTTKQETASSLAAFLAAQPGAPAETRHPAESRGRQATTPRSPRPPAAVDPATEDTAIVAPEGGADPTTRRARPTREAAKPPPAAAPRAKKPDPAEAAKEAAARAAEEAEKERKEKEKEKEKEALRAKVRDYATVGDEANPKVAGPAVAAPADAAPAPAEMPSRPDTEATPATPADGAKTSEPARSEAPATPAPAGEESRTPPPG